MRGRIIFPLLILLFLGLLAVTAFGYPHSARYFPLIFISIGMALFLWQVLREFQGKQKEVLQKQDTTEQVEQPVPIAKSRLRSLSVPAWIAALLLIIYFFGLLVGSPLFVFVYLKTHGERWLISLIVPLVIVVAIYATFTIGLKLRLYEGLLFSLL